MDAISYSYADKQAKRIKNVIADPDSTSGVLTVPKTIASGENITIPSGRVAVLPNVQIDGTLNVQGDVFIPSGATLSSVVEKVTSTDNAVVRFNGTTGEVQNSGVIIDDDNSLYINNSNSGSTRGLTVGGATKRILIGYDGTNNKGVINSADFGTIQTPLSLQGYELTFNTGIYSTLERMKIDSSGNVGIGTTPSPWGGSTKALDIGSYASFSTNGVSSTSVINNGYFNGSTYVYKNSNYATHYYQNNGAHTWQVAPTGTAGNTIPFNNAMTLDTSGNLLLTSGTGGLGYGTGSGGTVTQLTSKSTEVTLNKPTGTIITNGAALAAGATVVFTFFNNVYTADYDIINFQFRNNANATNYNIWATNNGPGYGFRVFIKNISASSLSDVLTINFSLTKGAIS